MVPLCTFLLSHFLAVISLYYHLSRGSVAQHVDTPLQSLLLPFTQVLTLPLTQIGPMLGLPRPHDSVSPASYASRPTSSSFEDSSAGLPASSANPGTNVHMTTQPMGHTASSSMSTVTPGSPPIAATPQQQRVPMPQRRIMPIASQTTTMTTAQAGPARPPVLPKPPAPRPAPNRRRAPKRARPSTSQGGGGGGDSDDDSDDDDIVEWGGPSAPAQGAATGMPGQRKTGACTHCKRLKVRYLPLPCTSFPYTVMLRSECLPNPRFLLLFTDELITLQSTT
ncbi:uncharacterized protein EDB91DRAFT_814304 [Suillus paluster]|uniref:uncharacterized protein n=1 Tax=Suillus paluster TaxID=48578 RepID=UPI001B861DF0|nr:uncharacterized protein EDB91DRAFT_814304 [Suillus paluster]KAG1729332.1 hypothetical protein EDB91DRAFT_814304 [Suillus paluster]